MDNEASVLVRVLDCGIFCVEYNIRAYNVVCGMIRLEYVPPILLVASKMNRTNNNNLFCLTKQTDCLKYAVSYKCTIIS